MVQSSKKVNDEFGVKGYEHIKYNPHLDKPTVYSIAKDSGKPKDYISILQKEKKLIPGPQYELGSQMGSKPKFFISKGNTPNFIGDVINQAKKTPGIGQYKTEGTKPKILGNYLQKSEGGGLTDDAIFRAMQTPPHYNPIELEKIKQRTSKWKIIKPTAKDDKKLVKDNSPSPHTYRQAEAKDRIKESPIKYGFSKSPKKSFTDFEIKKSKGVPGIGHYDIKKSDAVITIGARRNQRLR
uniref:Uncharacterized protein n=1 Tax=Strombidium rassoulzadegani TaxID=1082188 RepID=A0A7S3CNR6_9SPIT|mmetsp:Transcript_1876/g.3270  ORF Transcript_1876/g.3270 Transcript_1876/m.3270 type:complete len:239 (+) Transcript_1876:542-1258(+)